MRVANRGRAGAWWRVPAAALVGAIVAAPQVAAVWAFLVYARHAEGLPPVPDLAAFAATAPRSSRILAADGTLLAELPFVDGKDSGHRDWATFEELPPRLVEAILAAEDVRFFGHAGVDLRAVARAAWTNWRAGRTVEGASTITQQVARNLLPEEIGRERTVRRKLREAILARRLERAWPKPRILETWANMVFLGAGAHGVAAAARAYFDVPLAELTVAQAALVAGLAQAPGRADPFVDLAAARERRDEVLDRMLRAGFLDAATHAAARAEPVTLRPRRDPYGTIAPWITERARRELAASHPDLLATGGLVVETSALPLLAAEAEAAARQAAATIARRQRTPAPQVGAYLFDHHTGHVEAIVGGLDWRASRFDRATQACRQPGSAFKPLVFAAAIEAGRITPGTPLRDAPITEYDEDRGVFWKPTNSGRPFQGVALAQDALAASLNAPAVDVLEKVGSAAAIALARRLGITTELDPVRPLVLGSSCMIPAELARAFGAFAARGRPAPPSVIVRVVSRGETVLDHASPWDPAVAADRRLDRLVAHVVDAPRRRVLDETSAFLVSSMLAEGVRAGTGRDARAVGRPAAGKTGSTNEHSDAWFVGYTGRVTAAVWVGHDDPSVKLGKGEDGSHAALPVWVELVSLAERGRSARPVPGAPPEGVVTARVDRETGLLAAPGSATGVELFFRRGTEPLQTAGELQGVPQDLDRVSRDF